MNEKRFKLGITFNFSPQWMGGIIYIINLVKTLNFLEDVEKPEIFLFYKPELKRFLGEFRYPYINFIEWSFSSIIEGNIKSVFLRKNVFISGIIDKYSLDAVFPIRDFPVRSKTNVKLISWWADLQHKHYPKFFTKTQVVGRNIRIKLILRNCDNLVLSSLDVLDDFKQSYRLRKNLKVNIFHFVSVIENPNVSGIEKLRTNYNLPEQFFLISNQFHKHKNHRIVLLSIARLKSIGIRKHLAFTGKFPSAADSPYLTELHQIINDNNLHDQVTMLGVISRDDQLQLMRHSQAVIQPSLFEGWSTVIEDAKSLQVPVIASNLKVNMEQLGDGGCYFNPHNHNELADILKSFPERNISDILYEPYSLRIVNAAKEFKKILSE